MSTFCEALKWLKSGKQITNDEVTLSMVIPKVNESFTPFFILSDAIETENKTELDISLILDVRWRILE